VEVVQQLTVVIFVLALLGLALRVLRRGTGPLLLLRRGSQDDALQTVSRVALTPQHSLHVIRNGSEEWILATHPQGCTVIREGRSKGAAA
jgi:hypothetical protein